MAEHIGHVAMNSKLERLLRQKSFTKYIEEFREEALPTPTRGTWAESAAGFENFWRYPRGVGAIDGKHFRCVAPINSGSSYYNYKGSFSIVLMIVADSRYRIMVMDCGGKGRHSDSGMYTQTITLPFIRNIYFNFFLTCRTISNVADKKVS
ncbi:unnamed protein product [Cylicostephanus goldi]|uniref:DDE Tnp4 domain-containing protein n=1 Tax=Cylicostephanus goldi TaxID=71465 RepID=A0A3P6QWB4_CYLGO|nr:unnamed protein product [Cylicostephanus goldi]